MGWLERQFHLKEVGKDVKAVLLVGATAVMSMAHILVDNRGILSNSGVSSGPLSFVAARVFGLI